MITTYLALLPLVGTHDDDVDIGGQALVLRRVEELEVGVGVTALLEGRERD